jgi:hypothetical protein
MAFIVISSCGDKNILVSFDFYPLSIFTKIGISRTRKNSVTTYVVLASLAQKGNVVHFSGKARKMNHLSSLFASEASKKTQKRV